MSAGMSAFNVPLGKLRLKQVFGPAALLAPVVLIALAACGGGDDETLLVFAAASLKDSLTELSEQYEERTGIRVDISVGGSQTLAQQIVTGAPADVFIAAGSPPMDYLVDRGIVDVSGVEPLLGNELVIVTPNDGPSVDSVGSLVSDGFERIAIANPELAPAGAYSEEALRSDGIWASIQHKTLLGTDVRATMTYVVAGNADAALVYRTDAATTPSLRVAHPVPQELYSPIIYPGAVIAESTSFRQATEFLEFLASAESLEVFKRFGFVEPQE